MSRERHEPRSRADDERPEDEAAATRGASAESSGASTTPSRPPTQRHTVAGPRIWVLPAGKGEWWAVCEETQAQVLADALRNEAPLILCPEDAGAWPAIAARGQVDGQLREQAYEAGFGFFKRFLGGLAVVVVGIAGLRIPGKMKFFDEILLLCGLIYLGYAIFRHGYGAVRWHNRRVDAGNAFASAVVRKSALAERLAAALALREKLPPEQRGQSPDDELLDTNAYRKLVRDGAATRDELNALGAAIDAQLGLRAAQTPDSAFAETARAAGLTPEAAILYRDLANAAMEIRLDGPESE